MAKKTPTTVNPEVSKGTGQIVEYLGSKHVVTVNFDGKITIRPHDPYKGAKAGRVQIFPLTSHKPKGSTIHGTGKTASLWSLSKAAFDWNDDARGIKLLTAIREGISYRDFQKIASPLNIDTASWAKVLGTTTRTLERYKKEDKVFKAQQSERIIEIKQLYEKGLEVFDNRENFTTWLNTESIPLGNISPLSLLDTSLGITMVKDELGRIEHGILA